MNRVVLKPGKEKSMGNRHPWVFSGAIKTPTENFEAGEEVDIFSSKNEFLGRGYVNPHSQIRVRVFSWDDKYSFNKDFLRQKLIESIERRNHINRSVTNAIRLVAHESDLLPGLVVDQYNKWISFQILTAGMERHRDTIVALLKELLSPAGIVERSDESVRKKEGLKPRKELVFGTLPEDGIRILENTMPLLVDIWNGHKTGFYIDQRDNREIIRDYAKGRLVLNCFSYTGGFSIAAACGLARSITNVDESRPALEIAEKNEKLQDYSGTDFHYIEADVFEYLRHLKQEQQRFDMIILDPPKFVSSQRQINRACRGYKDLNLLAWKLLNPGGLLATFSCSGLISRDLFQKVVFGASIDAGCEAQIVKHLSQSEDHPTRLAFPESLYLKGLLLRKLQI